MAGLLTIETGFSCNSRCRYCTQLDYRDQPQGDRLDLDTAELLAKVRFGREQGFDEIGFSGGEPTIRPDFLALVRLAREVGYAHVGVTTNGRMFAYRSFVEAALDAGLDSFTFSLHGSTPALHDRISNARGALDQALQGLQHIQAWSRRAGRRLRLMNNQILLPENVGEIGAMVELLAPLDVRLFMIQPFIAQRSNSDKIGRFFVPYEAVVEAVRAALPSLRRHGARIKPYNVPNCLLLPLGRDVVEPQFYRIQPFREYERAQPGEFRAFRVRQWYRIDACASCQEVCPGFRIEQYPQARMVDGIQAAATAMRAQRQQQDAGADRDEAPLAFAGTELLEPATLSAAIAAVAQTGRPAAWLTSLCERGDRPTLARLAVEQAEAGHLAEVVLLVSPRGARFAAQRVEENGNLAELKQGALLLATLAGQGRTLPRLRALLHLSDAAWLLLGEVVEAAGGRVGAAHDDQREAFALLLAAMRRCVATPDLVVAVPNAPAGGEVPEIAHHAPALAALARRLHAAAADAGVRLTVATFGTARGLDTVRAGAVAAVEAALAGALPVESWEHRLFRHPLSMPEMDFVTWAPPWIFARPEEAS